MNYNDGMVHVDFFDKQVDLEKIAADFSEGDQQLQYILQTLWKNNIKTDACCKGHSDGRPAYIAFVINEESQRIMQATSEYLYLQDGMLELDFNHSDKAYDTFVVYMPNLKDKEDYFKFINKFLSQKDNKLENNNNLLTYASYLLMFARELNFECRFVAERENMMIGFCRPRTLQIFSEDSPALDDAISSIKEKGILPLIPFYCDETSLREFINVIYPNTFATQDTAQNESTI